MNPIKFEQSNRELTKPESMTDEECGSLHVFTDGRHVYRAGGRLCVSAYLFSSLDECGSL